MMVVNIRLEELLKEKEVSKINYAKIVNWNGRSLIITVK